MDIENTERSLWLRLIDYLNCTVTGSVITRQALLKDLNGSEISIDTYRNYLTQAGYLKIVSRGKYMLVADIILESLTVNRCKIEAYGRRK